MEFAGQQFIVYGDEAAWFTIHGLSDIHYGNKACSLDTVRQDIEAIRTDPWAFWVGVGDYAEYINHMDKRFDPTCVADDITVSDLACLGGALTERVAALFRPIRHKCLGLAFGNHEIKYMRLNTQRDMHALMCGSLDVLDLGYTGIFDIVFIHEPGRAAPGLSRTRPAEGVETWKRRTLVFHGSGYAQTVGGKANKVRAKLTDVDCDLLFIGHLHDKIAGHKVTLQANEECTEPMQREQKGVMCGSYLRTYAPGMTGYGEIKGYSPVPFGPGIARLRPQTKKMHVEV